MPTLPKRQPRLGQSYGLMLRLHFPCSGRKYGSHMDEHDISIEKRDPGFLASLFGAEPETVLVNKEGDVVGKIQTEEPGFLGSLCGQEAKQVIVDSDGEKVASFEEEEPGFIGSLLGEKSHTVLVGEGGDKLAEFDSEEPGMAGTLLGDKPKSILVDDEGEKLATFEREEPGLIGSVFGEESKRVIHFEKERVEGLQRRIYGADESRQAETRETASCSSAGSYSSEGSSSSTNTNEADATFGALFLGLFIVLGIGLVIFVIGEGIDHTRSAVASIGRSIRGGESSQSSDGGPTASSGDQRVVTVIQRLEDAPRLPMSSQGVVVAGEHEQPTGPSGRAPGSDLGEGRVVTAIQDINAAPRLPAPSQGTMSSTPQNATVTIAFRNDTSLTVCVTCSSPRNHHVWPSPGQAWVFSAGQMGAVTLSGFPGERIFYTAWAVQNPSIQWGMGSWMSEEQAAPVATCGGGTYPTVRLVSRR